MVRLYRARNFSSQIYRCDIMRRSVRVGGERVKQRPRASLACSRPALLVVVDAKP